MAALPSEVINFRAPAAKKALIDQAADALGKSRTEFMLDALCEKAREVLSDRTSFTLAKKHFDRFNDLVDQPLPDPAALKRLLKSRAPWER